MPVIKMSRTERGSCNGLTVETFEQGVEYDIPDSLIVEFATMGAIETPESEAPALEQPEPVIPQPQSESRDQLSVPQRGRKPKA